ncbi:MULTISPECIES: hypothetical protein [unclassified Kitasatospora]|uniref:hypothetical protein n=1 Tax=unclassified Kitasatospora TaxID=2633591 RepID=UPI002474B5FD|nr:hypothetical protein [Kitasatospora sp. MAP12-44]
MRQRTIALGTGIGLLAFLTAGCTSNAREGGAGSSPLSTVASAATPSVLSDAASRAAVLDTYRKYWDEQIKAYAQGSVVGTELEKYSVDQALSGTRADVYNNKTAGIVLTGSPKISPTVTTIELDKSPKQATLSDCLDISGWTPVDTKTGAARPVTNPVLRYTVTATARTVGSDWMISEVDSDMSRPC